MKINIETSFTFNWSSIAIAVASSIGLIGITQAQTVSLAKQRTETINGKQYLLTSKLKGVMLGNFYYNFNHSVATPNLDSTITRIGRGENPPWNVGRITTGAGVTTAALANYQVFFANYISSFASSGSFPSAGQTALQNFVEVEGKGLFIMHSSGDSRYKDLWPWYYTSVHPCHYTGETGAGNAKSTGMVGLWSGGLNTKPAKGHPIMEGITWPGAKPDSVSIFGMELHTFDKAITNSTITPANWQGLLGLNPATCGTANSCGHGSYNYSTIAPGGWAISWTFPLKKGNIGYFMEGHDQQTMKSMTQAVWDRYFKQFMYYMAGYDTIPASTVGPRSNLNFALDASGVSFHQEEAGVLITKSGPHTVSLFDVHGRQLKLIHGNKAPIDYNFSDELKNASKGIYVVRVAATGGIQRSQRFFLK